jgi:4-hydroxybenzoate polyprenyltransferase
VTERCGETGVGAEAFPQRWGLADWLRLLRMSHWVKNAIVFPCVILAGRAGEGAQWRQSAWVFVAFCLASSGVYALNDVLDRDLDRLHPLKSRRPVAAGLLAPGTVVAVALLLAGAGLVVASAAAAPAVLCVGLYLGLNLAYSFRLKHIPVVDAGCVAAGFVLRAVAVVGVPGQSPAVWLLVASVFFLCAFVAISKRAADLALLRREGLGHGVVRVVDGYTDGCLRGLLVASALLTVSCYLGFTRTVVGPAGAIAALSCLPVAYCLFRLARLSLAGARREQINLVLSDARLLAAAAVWAGFWGWAALA